MAVREIIRMGHPTLRRRARELAAGEIRSDQTRRLVTDMVDTLRASGGIGLAAPQIDESVRLAVIEIPGGRTRYGEIPAMPLSVFVNPRIEIVAGAERRGYWEGCLSVPGLRGFVTRPQHIRLHALNLDGEPLSLELQGFLATVFQHELDHLDGRLYVDLIEDPVQLVFEQEYERYIAPAEG
jgi:peptide deformylase